MINIRDLFLILLEMVTLALIIFLKEMIIVVRFL